MTIPNFRSRIAYAPISKKPPGRYALAPPGNKWSTGLTEEKPCVGSALHLLTLSLTPPSPATTKSESGFATTEKYDGADGVLMSKGGTKDCKNDSTASNNKRYLIMAQIRTNSCVI
jgi:hypothetical protein